MDSTTGLTLALGIGVPLVSALVYAAFAYPEFYGKHLAAPTFAAPFLLLVIGFIFALGYLAGAGAQIEADQAALKVQNLTAAVPSINGIWIIVFCGWILIAGGLLYLSTVSPHKHKD